MSHATFRNGFTFIASFVDSLTRMSFHIVACIDQSKSLLRRGAAFNRITWKWEKYHVFDGFPNFLFLVSFFIQFS